MVIIIVLVLLIIGLVVWYRGRKRRYKYMPTYTANVDREDVYVSTWHTELFVPNSKKINYTVNYHTINNFPYVENSTNIFLDGEPHSLEDIKSEVAITGKKEYLPRKNIPVIYVPYFVWAFVEKGMSPELLVKKGDDVVRKTKFCCFMYSNCDSRMDGVHNRKKFLEMMNIMTGNRVDNLGKCYNRNYKENGWWKSNTDLYRPYKFVIAFENKAIRGYITEKLINPMISRAIPIYLGAPDVGEYFNPKSFINVSSFPDFQSCIKYVMEVDSSDILYNSILREPFLYDNRVDKNLFSMYYGGEFYKKLYKAIGSELRNYIRPCKFYNNNIVFITFADGKVYRTDRIVEQAEFSGFFKKVVAYRPKDLGENFLYKHGKFIREHRRGYGWVWKPYVVLKGLSEIDYGDYLVYADSGCTISVNGYEKIKEYYSLLEKYDIITFPIKYLEKDWNKMDTVVEVCGDVETIHTVLEEKPEQRTSAVFLIKKTSGTVELVEKWYKFAENYHLIDDSPSERPNVSSFREHRHDQSILSILTKLYKNGVVVLDNYDDSKTDFMAVDGKPKAFVVSRLRD